MKRRSLKFLVPLIYAFAIGVAAVIGSPGGVVGTVLIGAVCVGFYYAATRQNMRDVPGGLPVPRDPPGHTHGYSPGAREREVGF